MSELDTVQIWAVLLKDIFFFLIACIWWIFFFAQFILPVRTNADRRKIFNRLFVRLFSGTSGPALFIENGRLFESPGESKKSGAGVIVLDTASAVVLKKFNKFTKTVGPGVVFTKKGEHIAEKPVPLKTLVDTAGPNEKDDPFAPDTSYSDNDKYQEIQKRRFETSALTRDGIEIVPNISIAFRIDAKPASGKEDGSRFGYNEESVQKAIWHTSINSANNTESVRWNQLPINLAVDLWREYVGKYRFAELFQETQDIPDKGRKEILETLEGEVVLPPHFEYGIRGIACDLLNDINSVLRFILKKVDDRISPPLQDEEKDIEEPVSSSEKKIASEKETALQSITRLMNERLKEAQYTPVNRYGKTEDHAEKDSPEYKFLTLERGIRILSVSVNDLRFAPELEADLVDSWAATWLKNAKGEKVYIEKHHRIRETKGKEKALIEYALALSKDVIRKKNTAPHEALQVLIRSTRKELIRNPQLLKEAEKEINQLTDMIQWVDKGGKPDAG
ncbi:MAG: hypothetical protein HN855_12505 [Anaerolineae bacterium]|nr:hypothetical protein [Anaerolineae bacterium]MBT7325975.1 hypothetical protein [Anaerolineae bacterium]